MSSDDVAKKLVKALDDNAKVMRELTRVCVAVNTNITQLGQLLKEKTDVAVLEDR